MAIYTRHRLFICSPAMDSLLISTCTIPPRAGRHPIRSRCWTISKPGRNFISCLIMDGCCLAANGERHDSRYYQFHRWALSKGSKGTCSTWQLLLLLTPGGSQVHPLHHLSRRLSSAINRSVGGNSNLEKVGAVTKHHAA